MVFWWVVRNHQSKMSAGWPTYLIDSRNSRLTTPLPSVQVYWKQQKQICGGNRPVTRPLRLVTGWTVERDSVWVVISLLFFHLSSLGCFPGLTLCYLLVSSLQQERLSAPFAHQSVRRAHGLRSAAHSTLFTQPPSALPPQVSSVSACECVCVCAQTTVPSADKNEPRRMTWVDIATVG